jgi:hypothetical protein
MSWHNTNFALKSNITNKILKNIINVLLTASGAMIPGQFGPTKRDLS